MGFWGFGVLGDRRPQGERLLFPWADPCQRSRDVAHCHPAEPNGSPTLPQVPPPGAVNSLGLTSLGAYLVHTSAMKFKGSDPSAVLLPASTLQKPRGFASLVSGWKDMGWCSPCVCRPRGLAVGIFPQVDCGCHASPAAWVQRIVVVRRLL